MKVEIGLSRREGPTLRIGGKWVHSPYAPQTEVLRFLNGETAYQEQKCRCSSIIVNGIGLGYLLERLRIYHPHLPLIGISYSAEALSQGRQKQIIPPDCFILETGQALEPLTETLPPTALESPLILNWEPILRIYPERRTQRDNELLILFKRRNANQMTTGYFGYRWMRNLLINFINLDTYRLPPIPAKPLIIAASGPSLNDHLLPLRRWRQAMTLWALPSSLSALQEAEIVPDLIISTDPGYYAGCHLRPWNSRTADSVLCQPLTAAPPPQEAQPLCPLNQQTTAETYLLKGFAFPDLPETGTVAASALKLFRLLKNRTDSAPCFCGLDTAWQGLQEHASPHPFEPLLAQRQTRLSPETLLHWDRRNQLGLKPLAAAPQETFPREYSYPSLNTYRDWFSQQRTMNSQPPMLMEPCAQNAPDLPRLSWEKFLKNRVKTPQPPPWATVQPSPLTRQQRAERGEALLRLWKESLPLATPGWSDFPTDHHRDAIQWLALPFWLRYRKNPDSKNWNRCREEALGKIHKLSRLLQQLREDPHAHQ